MRHNTDSADDVIHVWFRSQPIHQCYTHTTKHLLWERDRLIVAQSDATIPLLDSPLVFCSGTRRMPPNNSRVKHAMKLRASSIAVNTTSSLLFSHTWQNLGKNSCKKTLSFSFKEAPPHHYYCQRCRILLPLFSFSITCSLLVGDCVFSNSVRSSSRSRSRLQSRSQLRLPLHAQVDVLCNLPLLCF